MVRAYTTASEDARPGSVVSLSPTPEPLTQQRRLPKALAGASKSVSLCGLGLLLTLSAIAIGTLKGIYITTAVHPTRKWCTLRLTSYSLARTYHVRTTIKRQIISALPVRRTPSSVVPNFLAESTYRVREV